MLDAPIVPMEPLGDAQLGAFRAAMLGHLPKKLQLKCTFRFKASGLIPAGQWMTWVGETHSKEDCPLIGNVQGTERVALNCYFEAMQHDPEAIVLSEFPNKDVQYGEVEILAQVGGELSVSKTIKRPREGAEAPLSVQQATRPGEFEALGAALRGETKKKLVCENLRIPSEVWPRFAPLYPPLWTDLEEPLAAWKVAWQEFVEFHNLHILLPQKREQLMGAKAEMLAWLSAKPKPAQKMEWFQAFAITNRLFALTVFSVAGFAAEAKAAQDALKAFEKGFVDYEDIMPKAESVQRGRGLWRGRGQQQSDFFRRGQSATRNRGRGRWSGRAATGSATTWESGQERARGR